MQFNDFRIHRVVQWLAQSNFRILLFTPRRNLLATSSHSLFILILYSLDPGQPLIYFLLLQI